MHCLLALVHVLPLTPAPKSLQAQADPLSQQRPVLESPF